MGRIARSLAVIVGAVIALSGCGLAIPADPHGTLDQVRDGSLRVGVSANPPWTDTHDDREPSGIEPRLVQRFADELNAEVEWTEGGESTLVSALERGELDIVIGGILDDTPWVDQAAMTLPYTDSTSEHGDRERHVMLTRMGENAFLVELERFLLGNGGVT
ncbi:transporter substrate-binding domain-containing protein [Agromyces laixinhei]|uniref:transporter substrate-binding domain-containing protein n=1 Tax=Agromyces laixinhei TaxID=2585717 RepID=UPI001115E9C7|nr:transporter substrate-binding domain-containing protein [Agromyces laixinhei]